MYVFKITVHLVFICHLSAEDVQWVITVSQFFSRPLQAFAVIMLTLLC